MKEQYECPCVNGTLKLPGPLGPSSTATSDFKAENDEQIEEGDEKESETEDSWSKSGDFIYRHHEEPRLSQNCKDDGTFPWKDKIGSMESKILPDLTVFGMRLEHNFPRNKTSYKKKEWTKESARQSDSTPQQGIHKVSTNDKDYLKVIVDARTKLEKDTIPTVPCIVTEDSEG